MRLSLRIALCAMFLSTASIPTHSQAQTSNAAIWKMRVLAFDVQSGDLIRGVASEIFVMSPGNGKAKRLAEGESPVLDPTGDRLVFCTRQSNTAFGPIQSINTDGSGRRELFKTRSGACPTDWSADGESIAFNVLGGARSMIGTVKQDGSDVRILGEGYGAHWSRDGKRLVFCRDGEKPRMPTGIWVMDADGTHAEKITEDSSAVLEAGWLPDASGVAFSSSREKHRSAIFAVNLDGTGLRKIAGNEKLNFYFPTFSPDGSQLVVDSTNGSGLQIVDLDLTTLHGNSIAKGGHPSVVWQKD